MLPFEKKIIIGIRLAIVNLLLIFQFIGIRTAAAQEENIHQRSSTYQAPKDPEVLKKLEEWRNLKFGMIIHWGLYAVPGIIESWELCSEPWLNRPDSLSYHAYKQWYWGLNKSFNPVNFNPEQWASTAKKAGMKYLVFTTKHHDGFNMFDTNQTDYKITNGPFGSHSRANVAKHVFEAFRKEGMMIGAYFSKPDWHSQDFWWDKYATPNRNVNYDVRKFPERWNRFRQFAANQIDELTTEYGQIDILWLDGGWVRPKETVNDEVLSWGAPIPEFNQSIDIPGIVAKARKQQPGMLVVDRTVHGPYENYQTPERRIPNEQLPYPWESCLPLRNNWGYVPNDPAKSTAQIIHALVEVVAKGGSLLLGVGPKPDDTLREADILQLQEIGNWLQDNGKAIYNTRPAAHYQDGNIFFNRGKSGEIYALVNLKESEPTQSQISWKGNLPKTGSSITLLSTGKHVKWSVTDGRVIVTLPKNLSLDPKTYPTLTFEFSPANRD